MLTGADIYRDTIHILYVDDEVEFADMTAAFLERENDRFVVETAPSADDGLNRLADTTFDCIVSDYDMPTHDGINFLETVRNEYPDLPFILFTGKGSEEIASEAISAGVTDYFQKKFAPDQYAILANRIINAVSAERMNAKATRARQQLEQILETVPECIVQINAEGEFTFANERAAEVLGIEHSEVTQRAYNDPEWDITDMEGNPIPDEELPFRQVWASGDTVRGYRHAIRWPDGTKKNTQS